MRSPPWLMPSFQGKGGGSKALTPHPFLASEILFLDPLLSKNDISLCLSGDFHAGLKTDELLMSLFLLGFGAQAPP